MNKGKFDLEVKTKTKTTVEEKKERIKKNECIK